MTNQLTRKQYDRLAASLRRDADPDVRMVPTVYCEPLNSDHAVETWVVPVSGVTLTHVENGRAAITVYVKLGDVPRGGLMSANFMYAGKLRRGAQMLTPDGVTAVVYDFEVVG